MKALLHKLKEWLEDSPEPPRDPASRVKVRLQYFPSAQTPRGRARSIVVQRTPTPYWQERGWRKDGATYQGNYQTVFGSWPGRITVSPGGRVEVFIRHPPQALQRHPHWVCFQPRKGGWYFVHPTWPVPDVSAGIIGVEKTINESYAL